MIFKKSLAETLLYMKIGFRNHHISEFVIAETLAVANYVADFWRITEC